MGDICDMNDVSRFARSKEGEKHLESIRHQLTGRRISHVTFSNEVSGILMILELDDGNVFSVLDLSLQIEVLRDEFPEVLEREYYKDYLDRKPKET